MQLLNMARMDAIGFEPAANGICINKYMDKSRLIQIVDN